MGAKGDAMTFWIIVSVLALVVAATLGIALLRRGAGDEPAAAYDLRVYRDQLRDVDRDLERGVIAPGDAERIRAEVSRRILAADTQMRRGGDDSGQPRNASLVVAVLVGVALIGGSLAIYVQLGAPGYEDQPRAARIAMAEALAADRPSQAEIEAQMPAPQPPQLEEDYARLLDQLRAKVAERPDDLQGHVLLSRHEANIGNYAAARAAQARVMELKGENLLDAMRGSVGVLKQAGLEFTETGGGVMVKLGRDKIRGINVTTQPYPGFPTDMQAQVMAMMTLCDGASVINETIFENRFMHVPELTRMGADITVHGSTATVRGVDHLLGAPVMATDLRASMSLILAGLVADRQTFVNRVYHLDRGYERLVEKLSAVGAKIVRDANLGI